MPLPISRNRNRSLGDPVASADIDDLDDMIIGGRHGQLVTPFECFSAIVAAGTPTLSGSYWLTGGATDRLFRGVQLPIGTVITSLSLYGFQDDVAPISWELREVLANGSDNLLAEHGGSVSTGNKTLTTAMSITIASGRAYYLEFNAGQSNDSLYFFDVTTRK